MGRRLLVILFALAVLIGLASSCPMSGAQDQQGEQAPLSVQQNPDAHQGTPEQQCAAMQEGRGPFRMPPNAFTGPHGPYTNVIGPMSICTPTYKGPPKGTEPLAIDLFK